MGRASSTYSEQRKSLLIAHLLYETAVREQWGIANCKEGNKKYEKSYQWLNIRRKRFPKGHSQAQAIDEAVYQDEIMIIVISWDMETTIEQKLPQLLTDPYGIQLNGKEEANIPFQTTVSALGATFHRKDLSRLKYTPRAGRGNKHRYMVAELIPATGKLIPLI